MNSSLRLFLRVVTLCVFCCRANAQAPVANFTANIQTSCAPAVVNFTDQSTGNPTSWYWDLGNGTNAVNQNPSTTYLNPGVYTVVLTASNASGSHTITKTNYITITPTPTVSFFTPDTAGSCPPKTVHFTNQSTANTGGTVNYFWDFGDGTISNAANPVHTYSNAGNYTVSLVVTNSLGCTGILNKSQYIKVSAKPVTSFTATNNTGCTVPLTTTFTNTTTGAGSYLWLFGDGGTSTAASPAHTYNATSSYNVTLITQNGGCYDTLVKPAFVSIGNLNVGFTTSSTTACSGSDIAFTNTTASGAGNSTWHFGDGTTSTATSPAHAYTAPGTYTVKLVIRSNGCADSVMHNITVGQRPTARFATNDTASCAAPYTVSFSNTSLNASSYRWDFGDGSTSTGAAPSHTYTALGNYTVRLIAVNANGCTDTLTKSAYIKISPPLVGYGLHNANGCVPTTSIVIGSVSSIIPIASYRWNFGDGSTDTGINASHTYTAPGVYPITLTVTTVTGCVISDASHYVTIGARPTSNFTYTPSVICVNQGIQFTNTSQNATNYTWYFGDGTTSTLANPNHVYGAPGIYTVTLIAANNNCTDTMIKTSIITVNNPLADFKVTPDCSNRSFFTFINTSVGATSYQWNFGDGSPVVTTTTTASQPHTYAAPGVYTVTLTATSSITGCTSVKQLPIEVFTINPAFSANVTHICRGQSITFTAASTRTYGQYYWNFGDGTTQVATSGTVTHVYSQPGNFSVTLRLNDTLGCADSMRKINYIAVSGSNVAFAATVVTNCMPLVINFQDQSTSPLGSVIARTWRFGDGTSQNVPTTAVNHTYNNWQSYDVTLILTDANGCTDSLVRPAYINPTRPVAAFTSNDTAACIGRDVAFINSSTGGGPLSYQWAFGNGGTATATNPVYTYAANGNYTVRLVVTDVNGCKDTLTKPAFVKVASIKAGFTLSDSIGACPPLSVAFTNTSAGAVSYVWDFGNGNSSTSANPTNIYTTAGTFTATLRVTNANGCTDSFRRTIHVNPLPTGTISYTPIAGCLPLTISLSSTNSNTTSFVWDFDNGVIATGSSSTITYTYTQPGLYIPRVIFTNGLGCNNAVAGSDTVKVNKVNAGFTAVPATICAGGSVDFTDTSRVTTGSVTAHDWSFGDGGTGTGTNASHTYATAGTYTVRLISGTGNGCADTTYRTVLVNPKPAVVTANRAICTGDSATLLATGAATYSWSPATGLSCTTCANPTARPAATTTYTVTGTSPAGCINTAEAIVAVNPLPTVSAGSARSICNGTSTQLTATGASTYSWSPAAGLSCTNCFNPVANPNSTTTYTVTGTSATGCVNTAQVTVTVINAPVLAVTPNQTICAGASVALNASGAASYSWSPAAGLSCANCANPTATPTATTTYTVLGNTVTNGCQTAGSVTITVNPLPAVSAGANQVICSGDSAVLNATGAATYSWSPATGLSCTTCASPTARPATAATYMVTGTSAVGCVNTAQVSVSVNPLPVVSAGANQNICAGSSATLTASGASTYNWSPATGLSATTGASVTASPAVTTLYTVTGTNANGCKSTAQVTVTVNPLPVVSAGPDQFICPGGSVPLAATGASTYSWSPATGLSTTTGATVTASPAATTTYTVTGTTAAGCTSTAQVTVHVNNAPAIQIAGNSPICTGGNIALTASGAQSYTWSPATGLSATTGAAVTASPATTTTYTITGTSGVGCTGTTQVTVVVNPLPTVSAGANQSICAGGSVPLAATGANTYTWSPATGLSATTGATVTALPAATTTYTVTGTSAAGCVNTAQVTVAVNPLPVVSAGANQFICPGGSVPLTATGANTYTWSPATGLSATTGASVTASPAATTTYTVTGANGAGCTSTAQVTVQVNNTPVINVTGNSPICAGGSVALAASGANTYSWSPATGLSATTGATVTAAPANTTTYTITGASGAGCTGSTQVTVVVNPLPTVSAGTDQAICAGSSTTITATGAATYSWSPATGLSATTGATVTASPAVTTTYTVTGTSAAGCTSTAPVTITVNPKPTITAASQFICPGGSTTLNATGAATYSWSPATGLSTTTGATVTASPAATTTYTITGTAVNGCVNTTQVTVTVNPVPNITIAGNNSICLGAGTILIASGANAYSWSPATGLNTATGSTVTASPAATTTYTVTGTSGTGCTNTAQVTVAVHNPPAVAVTTSNHDICAGSAATLTAGGASTYTWSPVTGLSTTTGAATTASPNATTTYIVTGTDGFGCTDTGMVTINVKPLPVLVTSRDTSICGATAAQLAVTGASSYVWSPAAGLSCTTCSNPVATPAGTNTYTVTGTGSNGCTGTAHVTVTIYAQPAVNAGPDQTVCAGQPARLQASGASTYTWSPAGDLSCPTCPDPVAIPVQTASYRVIGTDVHGCVDSDQVVVTVIQRDPVSAGQNSEICAGESVQLFAKGGTGYSWSPAATLNNSTLADPVATPEATTTYKVVIRQAQCFSDTLAVTVTVHPLPTISAGPDRNLIAGTSTVLQTTGTNVATYAWSPAAGLSCATCANPTAMPEKTTTYTVRAESEHGCKAEDDVTLMITCDGSQLWVPNTFTPNGDGQNDRFYPHGKGITTVTRFRIYDRWGELLYDLANMPVDDASYGWDGTYKNRQLKPDVYVYIINGQCTTGEPLEIKGDISLIR